MRLSTRPVENVEGETLKGGIPELLNKIETFRQQARVRTGWTPGLILDFRARRTGTFLDKFKERLNLSHQSARLFQREEQPRHTRILDLLFPPQEKTQSPPQSEPQSPIEEEKPKPRNSHIRTFG